VRRYCAAARGCCGRIGSPAQGARPSASGRGEAGDQADYPEGQDLAGIGVAGIADTAEREEERADAEQCRRDAEHRVEGFHALLWPSCARSALRSQYHNTAAQSP
jgi:hypothetical protein